MLSEFSALTFILLSGYLFQASVLPLRIRSSLHNRYHTLFGAALWGVLLFTIVGYFLDSTTSALERRFQLTEIFSLITSDDDRVNRAVVYALLLAAVMFVGIKVLGLLAKNLGWQWYGVCRERVVSFSFARYGSNMLKLVNDAYERSLPIQVTLSNRKIYIGLISDTVDTESGLFDFRLVPFESGYRDGETLCYTKTTEYRVFHELFEFFKEHERAYSVVNRGNAPSPRPEEEWSQSPDELVLTIQGGAERIEIPGTEIREMANNFGIVIRWDQVETIAIWDKRLSEYFFLTRESAKQS